MNPWDIVILVLIAAAVLAGLLLGRSRRRKGRSCCGDCAACGKAAEGCAMPKQD